MLHFQYATFNIQHKHELPLAGVLLNTDALKMATQWAGHSVTWKTKSFSESDEISESDEASS